MYSVYLGFGQKSVHQENVAIPKETAKRQFEQVKDLFKFNTVMERYETNVSYRRAHCR